MEEKALSTTDRMTGRVAYSSTPGENLSLEYTISYRRFVVESRLLENTFRSAKSIKHGNERGHEYGRHCG